MPRCNIDELVRTIQAGPTQPAIMPSRSKSAGCTSSSLLKTPLPPIAASSDTWSEDLSDSNNRPRSADHSKLTHNLKQRQQEQEPFFMTEVGYSLQSTVWTM